MGGTTSSSFHESNEFDVENAKIHVEYKGARKPIDPILLHSTTNCKIALTCIMDHGSLSKDVARIITKYVGSTTFMRNLDVHVSNTEFDWTGRYDVQHCINLPIKMELVKTNKVKVNVREDTIHIAFTVRIAKDDWNKTTRLCDIAFHFASAFLWSVSGSGDFRVMTERDADLAGIESAVTIHAMHIKFLDAVRRQ